MRSSNKSSLDRLVGNYGTFIFAAGTYTIDADIHISAIVAGEYGATITSIRLEKRDDVNGIEYKYAHGAYDWDGVVLGAGEICEIPVGYRVKTLTIDSQVKIINSEEVVLTEA